MSDGEEKLLSKRSQKRRKPTAPPREDWRTALALEKEGKAHKVS